MRCKVTDRTSLPSPRASSNPHNPKEDCIMANQFDVKAKDNSVSGGTPLVTGITVTKGELLTISVSPDDKWSAGVADRESNANGLSNPFGGSYGLFTHNGFSFFYGS